MCPNLSSGNRTASTGHPHWLAWENDRSFSRQHWPGQHHQWGNAQWQCYSPSRHKIAVIDWSTEARAEFEFVWTNARGLFELFYRTLLLKKYNEKKKECSNTWCDCFILNWKWVDNRRCRKLIFFVIEEGLVGLEGMGSEIPVRFPSLRFVFRVNFVVDSKHHKEHVLKWKGTKLAESGTQGFE